MYIQVQAEKIFHLKVIGQILPHASVMLLLTEMVENVQKCVGVWSLFTAFHLRIRVNFVYYLTPR